MAIASLICGILGVIGGLIPVVNYFTLLLSILGIVLGLKAKKELAASGEPTGMATAGFVFGIIGVSMAVISILFVLFMIGGIASIATLAI